MKIVHIITRLIIGGAQENTLITCKLLSERGHNVTLLTGPALGPEGQLFSQTEGQKYGTYVIKELRRPIAPLKDYLSYHKIKGMLEGMQPDIVHTHSAKGGILGRRAAYQMGKHRPKIVHGVHGLSFHPYQNALVNKAYIAIERASARQTDHFITVADAMTTQSHAVGIGTDKPYTTAYSAIDEGPYLQSVSEAERRAFRTQHDIPQEAIVLVCVARLFMLKGHDYIIESAVPLARRFPRALWLFVGDGKLTASHRKRINKMGLEDRFRFTGLLRPDEVPLAIKASDILVHCSLREGLARTLPQAMLCSRPAISFDVDGAREVVNDQTGRLVRPMQVGDLVEACAELIQDPALREQLGRNGLQQVREKFAPDKMVDTIEGVYRSLVRG